MLEEAKCYNINNKKKISIPTASISDTLNLIDRAKNFLLNLK